MFANMISSSLWPSLLLSAIFLAFILHSSNPFTFIRPKQVLITQSNESLGEEKAADSCDLFVGRWVREPKGSLYTNSTCSMLPEMKNCAKYGKEQGYVYWRWRPDGCDLPRFDPTMFLSVVREKTMAFVGDSLGRNQMESLLCLLSQVSDCMLASLSLRSLTTLFTKSSVLNMNGVEFSFGVFTTFFTTKKILQCIMRMGNSVAKSFTALYLKF